MPLDAQHVGWLLVAVVAYLMLRAVLAILLANMQRRLDVYNLALHSRQMRLTYLGEIHDRHEREVEAARRKQERHAYYMKHGVYPDDAGDEHGNSSVIIEDDAPARAA